jgi:putative flippase GtrA
MKIQGVILIDFFRFCLVGGASTVLGMALLFTLTDILGIHYILSFLTSYIAINLLTYIISRRYIFPSRNNGFVTGAMRYYAVNIFSLCLNTSALYFLVDWLGLPYLTASLLLSASNAPINYILHKRISFQISGLAPNFPKG